MTTATQLTEGLAYLSEAEATLALAQYGLTTPTSAKLVSASRLVDGLQFRTDLPSRTELERFAAGDNVPIRIGTAVALIATATIPAPPPTQELSSLAAGDVSLDFDTASAQPGQSDDEVLAARLGIPEVRAFQLLRPYLVLPDNFRQVGSTIQTRGVSPTLVSGGGLVTEQDERL